VTLPVATVVHLGLALLCVMLGTSHLLIAVALRSDRMHRWMAANAFGFALVDLSIAGAGMDCGGLGARPLWIALGVIPCAPVFAGLLMVCWHVLGVDRTPRRRAIAVAFAAFGLLRTIEVVRQVTAPSGAGLTWESSALDPALWTTTPFWLGAIAVPAIWIGEALPALRTVGIRGAAMLAVAIPALALALRENLWIASGHAMPTLFGLAAIPIVVFSSMMVAIEYVTLHRKGDELSRYRPIRVLGSGGMGELLLATLTGAAGFERHVALKRVHSGAFDGGRTERLLDEARVAARLRHPNIVDVLDVGRLEDGWFMVMEYLPGASLAQLETVVGGGKLGEEILIAVAEATARGLAYAHAHGVVHRDVSPDNVMITFSGEVKLIDFGIAKLKPGAFFPPVEGATEAGRIVGKVSYLSPERARGELAGPASDVYALGVVLYELLSGRRPVEDDDRRKLLRAIRDGAPHPPLESRRPGVDPALAALVERMLAHSPAERPGAEQAASALGELAASRPRVELGEWLKALLPGSWALEQRIASGAPAPATLTGVIPAEVTEATRPVDYGTRSVPK
jgi:hypothetical protein